MPRLLAFVNAAWYHISMNQTQKAILIAYKKGYRVSDSGVLTGMNGKILSVSNGRYPTFSVNVGENTNSGVYGVPVHMFAAYCFYGEKSFQAECIRHLNGRVKDFSKKNIVLGTHSDNNMDKSPESRSAAAKKARAAQGHRAKNSKFSDDEIRYIREQGKKRSQQSIADEFSVTRQCINLILKGKNYNDVA